MALGIYEEEDIRALAEEIRDRSGGGGRMTVKQMKDGIANVYYFGEGNGYSDGYIGGFEYGKEQGKTEGLAEGKSEAYAEVEPINTQLENTLYGTDTGGKSYYDEFWDNFQNYGKKSSYPNAFTLISYTSGGWTDATYNPKYEIVCNGNANGANSVFVWNNQISDIKVPMDCRGVAMTSTFLGTYKTLKRIPLLRVNEQTTYASTFDYCQGLTNFTIDGTIGQNGFNVQWSTKLSKASIISIINALSTTTSGLSVTLSKTAVETAFGSTASEEWIALINARSNWTINLV